MSDQSSIKINPNSANQLAESILELRRNFIDAHRIIVKSNKCNGCSLVDDISANRSDLLTGHNYDQSYLGDEFIIKKLQSLLSEAAECKMINLDQSRLLSSDQLPKSRSANFRSDHDQLSMNKESRFSQTSPSININRLESTSQTDLSSKYLDELEKSIIRIKENNIESTRNSLAQLLKLSATELEREENKSKLQFVKSILRMTDNEFDQHYRKYLNGLSIDELRQSMIGMNNLNSVNDQCGTKYDFKRTEFLAKIIYTDMDDHEFFQFQAAENKKIKSLNDDLAAAKTSISSLVKLIIDMLEMENSSLDKIACWIDAMGELTNTLIERNEKF